MNSTILRPIVAIKYICTTITSSLPNRQCTLKLYYYKSVSGILWKDVVYVTNVAYQIVKHNHCKANYFSALVKQNKCYSIIGPEGDQAK